VGTSPPEVAQQTREGESLGVLTPPAPAVALALDLEQGCSRLTRASDNRQERSVQHGPWQTGKGNTNSARTGALERAHRPAAPSVDHHQDQNDPRPAVKVQHRRSSDGGATPVLPPGYRTGRRSRPRFRRGEAETSCPCRRTVVQGCGPVRAPLAVRSSRLRVRADAEAQERRVTPSSCPLEPTPANSAALLPRGDPETGPDDRYRPLAHRSRAKV
jgi:hypothetical protein